MAITHIARKGQRLLRKVIHTPMLRTPLQLLGNFTMGFVLSAASLAGRPMPVAMAVLCAGLSGWQPAAFVFGSCLGFRYLWQEAGMQALVWLAGALPVGVLLGEKFPRMPLLQPAFAALILSASGVAFQFWQGDTTPVFVYLLRVGLAFGATWVFCTVRYKQQTTADWVAVALIVLGLAQLAPVPWLNLGVGAAAFLAAFLPFPAVALAGLALDVSQVTAVPMTAVLCAGVLLRLLSGEKRRLGAIWPLLMYIPVMALSGVYDLYPLPALAAGCLAGAVFPLRRPKSIRRGETGLAQVRLEMAAEVLAQTELLLRQTEEPPIDRQALVFRAAQRACGGCSLRGSCDQIHEAQTIPVSLLNSVLTSPEDIPVDCRKRGRLLPELRRSQEQLRLLKADRRRQREYRSAVAQQYRFLAAFLQDLADKLPRQTKNSEPLYRAEVAASAAGREKVNGDRCCWFSAGGNRYFVLLCDGMGTGGSAASEAALACDMLRKLLMAGMPAAHALRSLNNLCTLQGRAGAVTVDLAELNLESGGAILYKWGAAPSYLLTARGPERVGAMGVPPGLSVTRERETVCRLQLRRGQALVLLSDGVAADYAVEAVEESLWEPAASLASRLLEKGKGGDDATVAVIRLHPLV